VDTVKNRTKLRTDLACEHLNRIVGVFGSDFGRSCRSGRSLSPGAAGADLISIFVLRNLLTVLVKGRNAVLAEKPVTLMTLKANLRIIDKPPSIAFNTRLYAVRRYGSTRRSGCTFIVAVRKQRIFVVVVRRTQRKVAPDIRFFKGYVVVG
jgi:hypothetical protein